jgi:DNA polymerase-4
MIRQRNDARAILHIDMDAFYASVEEQDRPELKGKPLIVGGTGGRGVVAAASYAVRRYGVRSAMPIASALRLCPDAIVVHPRMARYKEISGQVFAIFHEFTPLVEGLSLDEAFLDVTASRQLLGRSDAIGAEIRRRIAKQTGLTASVGIAPNKLLAKIASDLNKPDGMCRIDAGNLRPEDLAHGPRGRHLHFRRCARGRRRGVVACLRQARQRHARSCQRAG